ncbi:hypothetical protein AOB57_013720 [Methanosarcina flavescens]|uniref:Uncharacterized protein n=1 Tax=Methanosarcina flavescens TaxID=1715806 RepID=A0A660HW95_9EURY|nr:hypothetical protein AOB57_013720 [Methanosarcina flavescens]
MFREPPFNLQAVNLKLLCRNRCAGLSPSVAPFDHAVLIKAWFLIKFFSKKFVIKHIYGTFFK